jgi:hypothetical protein
MEPAERSSGAARELRRKGISCLKNSGLKSEPMMFVGNDARFGLMMPIAISTLRVHCARAWDRDISAPLPYAVRTKPHDALSYLCCWLGLKNVLHKDRSSRPQRVVTEPALPSVHRLKSDL